VRGYLDLAYAIAYSFDPEAKLWDGINEDWQRFASQVDNLKLQFSSAE